MSVTAKVKCTAKSLINMGTDYETVQLRFGADYADGRNKEWSVATPVINLELHVKPEVGQAFGFGQPYTLTFEAEEN